MKIQRVAAFTLMEVTIAMLISALVISMTYTIYIIVAHSFTAFNQKNNTIAMETRLDELLQKILIVPTGSKRQKMVLL